MLINAAVTLLSLALNAISFELNNLKLLYKNESAFLESEVPSSDNEITALISHFSVYGNNCKIVT